MGLEIHAAKEHTRTGDNDARAKENWCKQDDHAKLRQSPDRTFYNPNQVLADRSVDRTNILGEASDNARKGRFVKPSKSAVENGVHELVVDRPCCANDSEVVNDRGGTVKENVDEKDRTVNSEIAITSFISLDG